MSARGLCWINLMEEIDEGTKEALKQLYLVQLQNEACTDDGDETYRLSPEESEFLLEAIMEEEAHFDERALVKVQDKATEELRHYVCIQQKKMRKLSLANLKAHMDTLESIKFNGMHAVRCATEVPIVRDESGVVKEHIHNHVAPARGYPKWYPSGSPLSGDEDDHPDSDDADGEYTFGFLTAETKSDDVPGWKEFAASATTARQDSEYFKKKWGIAQLEKLRLITIAWFYDNGYDDDDDDVKERCEVEMEFMKGRRRWLNEEWQPALGKENMWRSAYRTTIHERLDAYPPVARDKEDGEITHRKGPANDVFVWRLVVVHLHALRAMEVPPYIPVTDCFDMDTLVANVAHLIKYRRCIKWAKSIYKTAGIGSLHDQYRAKLLNKNFTHEHQDESDSELGIARRMIRQAHVANYVQYMYEPGEKDEAVYKPRNADVKGKGKEDVYRTEQYLTNPPMAPIMCTAPPRMGKSALSMLMASFAVKMGGVVQYGVAPNKVIPQADTEAKLEQLGWVKNQGMQKPEVRIYSHDDVNSVEATNIRLQDTANSLAGWVLHIRDEAQTLVRQDPVADTARSGGLHLKEQLENTFPIFYGLNMCVSATLLPVMGLVGMTGDDSSIRDLLDNTQRRPIDRPHREQCVVLQPWSFPLGPNFLVPPKSAYPKSPANVPLSSAKTWYQYFYEFDELDDDKALARSTNYYGTWFHLKEHRKGSGIGSKITLQESNKQAGVLLDDSLDNARIANQNWVNSADMLGKGRGNGIHFKPLTAYVQYLKNFNRHNTRYWDEEESVFKDGAATRIANSPFKCLTLDASWFIEHAQAWMEDASQQSSPNPPPLGTTDLLHPILITAPKNQKDGKNGRIEWATLLCKLSWLRMHKDYVSGRLARDVDPDELARRYGVTVLVYSSDKSADAYLYVVAKPEDIHLPNKSSRVVAITFDPRLPENRFVNHFFTHASLAGANKGRLLPSILIPTITEDDIKGYKKAYNDSNGGGISAYNYLRNGDGNGNGKVQVQLYRFDMNRCYEICDERDKPARELVEGADDDDNEDNDHEVEDGGHEGEGEGEGESEEGGGEDDEDDDKSDSEIDTTGVWPHFLASKRANATPMNVDTPTSTGADNWRPLLYQGDPDPTRDDREDTEVEKCEPATASGDEEGHPVTDLNAIALRLCVTGFGNAQEATEASLTKCSITKIAAVGYKMFEAGLTLQTTIMHGNVRHMFVPKFMSIAPSEKDGHDLSKLYQLVGRGFVDMKRDELPVNWKLDLLATRKTIEICRFYGNAELLLSHVDNESLEGRKMTLGTVLRTIREEDRAIYADMIALSAKGKTDLSFNLMNILSIDKVAEDGPELAKEDVDEDPRHSRPFRNVRDCLTGPYAPLLQQDAPVEPPAMASFEEQRKYNDEFMSLLQRQQYITDNQLLQNGMRLEDLAFGGLNIVQSTNPLKIIDVHSSDCKSYPKVADAVTWKDQVIFDEV